jgi:hypothetical protein
LASGVEIEIVVDSSTDGAAEAVAAIGGNAPCSPG